MQDSLPPVALEKGSKKDPLPWYKKHFKLLLIAGGSVVGLILLVIIVMVVLRGTSSSTLSPANSNKRSSKAKNKTKTTAVSEGPAKTSKKKPKKKPISATGSAAVKNLPTLTPAEVAALPDQRLNPLDFYEKPTCPRTPIRGTNIREEKHVYPVQPDPVTLKVMASSDVPLPVYASLQAWYDDDIKSKSASSSNIAVPAITPRGDAWDHLIGCVAQVRENVTGITPIGGDDASSIYNDPEEGQTVSKRAAAEFAWLKKLVFGGKGSSQPKPNDGFVRNHLKVKIGAGDDVGGVQRDWISSVWMTLTHPKFGFVLQDPENAPSTVFLNPALDAEWAALVLIMWAKHAHIDDKPVPTPALDGRCLWWYLHGTDQQYDGLLTAQGSVVAGGADALVHDYLLLVDTEYRRVSAQLALLTRPRITDGRAFDSKEGLRLLAFLRESLGLHLPDNLLEAIRRDPLPYSFLQDELTQQVLEYDMKDLHLYLGSPQAAKILEAHDGLDPLKEAEPENTSPNPNVSYSELLQEKRDREGFLKEPAKMHFNTLISLLRVDGQEWEGYDGEYMHLSRDLFSVLGPQIRAACIKAAVEQRKQVRQSAALQSILPPGNWPEAARVALQYKPVQVTAADLQQRWDVSQECVNKGNIFYGLPTTPINPQDDDNSNRPLIGAVLFKLQCIDLLERLTQNFQEHPNETFVIDKKTGLRFDRPKCPITPLEACVRYFTGSITPGFSGPHFESCCIADYGDREMTHYFDAHTCPKFVNFLTMPKPHLGLDRGSVDMFVSEILNSACSSGFTKK